MQIFQGKEQLKSVHLSCDTPCVGDESEGDASLQKVSISALKSCHKTIFIIRTSVVCRQTQMISSLMCKNLLT